MKKALILAIVGIALAALSSVPPSGKLVGRWQAKLPNNMSAVTAYRPDGTFDVFLNGKTFVSGQYRLNLDTLSVTDPTCGVNYYGSYRLTFITPDSIRLTMIRDTCQGRSSFVSQALGSARVKPSKP